MALIRITRNLTLNSPLLSNKGERITKIRLDGSFAFTEKDNEAYISYDRDEEKWYINFDSVNNELLERVEELETKVEDLETCCADNATDILALQNTVASLQAQIYTHHPPPPPPDDEIETGPPIEFVPIG